VKILRSIAAVIVGLFTMMVTVGFVERLGHEIYPWPEGVNDPELIKKFRSDPAAGKKFVDELPTGAIAVVLFAWQIGAFFGALVAALIAASRRYLHAGIIGGVVLLASIAMMMLISHPDWMIVAGLLLPMPLSLIAGKLVSLLFPPPPPVPPS
jgi:hypothetical protein